MKKIAQGIVRLRKLILTVAVLLLIPSAIGAIATRINYDILTYLPQDLDSMIGEVALEDDFHLASTGMITVEGLPTNELIAMKKEIEAVPGVTQTFWLSDVIDPNIPTAMLPADVQQFMFGKNDSTMLIVRFDAPSASDETMEAVQQIEKLLRKDCFFGGMSVILQDTKALVNQEMPLYILIAVGASLLVLFLSLESTITPLLFMLGLLFPIVYNFGTNIFLGQISYITEALATVLQLGVTMDFSIFLLHRYQEEKELRSSNEEAMTSAICKTMTSISASSLTTIAGFLALCAMRLTLGRDIGLVMAKGVALGVICTVVILPSLILTFDKWVEKYKHRTVIPRLTKLSYFVSKHSVPIVAVFILILIPFAIAQNKTSVYYTLFDSLPQDLTGIVGTNKLGEDFGMTTSHFILVHDDLTATQVSDLCDELKDVDGITQVVSLDSITGPGFDTELLPDSVMEILQSGGYKLILANSSYKTGTDAINSQLDETRRTENTRVERTLRFETERAKTRANRDLSAARMAARATLAAQRQKIADETFSKAREQLAAFVAGKDYAAWLQKEAASLAETLGENAKITARAADLPLLKNVELPAGTVLEADDSITLGGLKGANPAKGVAADDTLEARLEAQHDWFLENAGLEINI